VNPIERTASPASTPKTGLVASLGGLLRVQGSGLSTIIQGTRAPRVWLLPVLVLGLLAFTVAPALAAGPPEKPLTGAVTANTGTSITFNGTANPGVAPQGGTYQFLYKKVSNGAGCEGESATVGGVLAGLGPEPVSEPTAVEPDTGYTVCLAATNLTPETTVGNAVIFTTKALPPTVEAEYASPKAEEARLEAVVNANNEEVTECKFQYGTSATLAAATITACVPATLAGLPYGQGVGLTVTGLAQNTTYYYRVSTKNATGETQGTAVEPIKHFTTSIHPETPTGLQANPIAANTATLNGVLNPGAPGNPGSYEFIYRPSGSTPAACQGEGEVATPVATATGAVREPAEAKLGELQPNTSYTFCLRAKNDAGEEALSAPVTFRTLPEAFATNLASSSVTLHGVLDPEGASLSYHFEYGTSIAYGSQTPEASTSLTSVEAHIQDLSAATLYHYRVLATNAANETFESEDRTFTTESTVDEFTLPDGRQYEMVTPPAKEGATFETPLEQRLIKASANGDAINDIAHSPTEAEPEGSDEGLSVLSLRGSQGWSSRDISSPRTGFGSLQDLEGAEPRFFSEDLSQMVLQQLGQFTPLSPEASESTPYLHTNFYNHNVSERCEGSYRTTSSCYHPLVTKANTRAGAVFGEVHAGLCVRTFCGPEFKDANPDLSAIVIEPPAFTPETRLTPSVPPGFQDQYLWSDGQLQALPGKLAGQEKTNGAPLRAISSDGKRVILENESGYEYNRSHGLSLLDLATGETLELVEQGALLQGANSEDSRVFFTDTERLTADAGAGGADLYECEIVEVNGKLKCNLSDLTPPMLPAGEPANVRVALGVSNDGSYVYFAAGGALTPNAVPAVPGTCGEPLYGSAPTEGCNVYVRHDGVTRLVAKHWQARGGELFTRVSPDGQWLAFTSSDSLTGYDNRDALSGQRDAEIYLYHAEASPSGVLEAGKLLCASCSPTGARPVGTYETEGLLQGWAAATLPERTGVLVPSQPRYQQRYLSDSGRLFFDSSDSLVPQDVNGVQDVYEYEPEGDGAASGRPCAAAGTSGSEVFKPARAFDTEGVQDEEGAGCLALISSGASSEPSWFLDASESGGDVFFLTSSQLAPQDVDHAADVYDAHECTSASPCTTGVSTPPPCTTEASCKPPPTPQPGIYGLPASATFSGPGNITPPPPAVVKPKSKAKSVKCKKHFVKNKQGKCITNKKQTKAKKARKASNDRRTK
jgi:hypothetical protein